MLRLLASWLGGSLPIASRPTRVPCWPRLAVVLTMAIATALSAADPPAAATASAPPEVEAAQPSPSDAPSTAQGRLASPQQSAEKQIPQKSAPCSTFRVRAQDQIWLVSTRRLGCAIGGKYEPALDVWRYEQGWWQPRTLAQFYAEDAAEVVTPIYVHGNQIDAGLASSYGLNTYFELVGKLDDPPAARFVIWSWPSDQIKGPLRDVREKAARSDIDAWYLGSFLSRIQPDVRVGLVGYSFGARIVSGAMHLLGGGSLFGMAVSSPTRPQVRVAMWAAAEHNHWYLPGQFHAQALAAGDAWFITVNSCDPVLARYRMLDKCDNPCAVGYAGVYGRNLLPPDVNARIEEVNISNIVGGEHHWRPYLYSPYIQNRTRDYALWQLLESSWQRLPAAAASD